MTYQKLVFKQINATLNFKDDNYNDNDTDNNYDNDNNNANELMIIFIDIITDQKNCLFSQQVPETSTEQTLDKQIQQVIIIFSIMVL